MENKELVIDETNFTEYFFDIRKHKPKKDQVLACFTATAELVDGILKRDLVDMLLTNPKGGEMVPRLLYKNAYATEKDSVRLAKQIATDLKTNSRKVVLAMSHEYTYQVYYWTQKECVPTDDYRWSMITILNTLEEKPEEGIDSDHGRRIHAVAGIMGQSEQGLRDQKARPCADAELLWTLPTESGPG